MLLPVINAIFDYISMYISRRLSTKILNITETWKIFLDILLDLFFALFLLGGLAFSLYFVIDLFNVHFIKEASLRIPLLTYREHFFTLNFWHEDMAWISMMFISTLIPTLAHLFIGFYAIYGTLVTKPHLHILVSKLQTVAPNTKNNLEKEELYIRVVKYELTNIVKIQIYAGIFLISTFLIVLIAFSLKVGILEL